jgi:uncharacterized DUF497 family protein
MRTRPKHGIGIDFDYAMNVFLDKNRIEKEDRRRDYGESRYITIGKVVDILLTVVYTMRKDKYRLISARRASYDEREAYYQNLA